MTLPSYVHFTGPLLQYLGEQQGSVRPRVVYEVLAQRLGLSEEDRTARLPSGGQSVLQNRIGWAHDAPLQLQGADKGVLITSGSISGPAYEAARQARGSVVLIDGARLAELMIEHEVGVSSTALRIPKIDTDYFEGG